MYEVFTRLLVSAVVVGPTGNPEAAKVYAHKVGPSVIRPISSQSHQTFTSTVVTGRRGFASF